MGEPGPLTVTVTSQTTPSGMTVIGLSGELDFYTAPALREALLAATASDRPMIILDLEHLRFMDSTGFSVFLAGRKHAMINGGELGLAAPTDWVRKMLAMAGLTKVFNIYETAEQGETGLAELLIASAGGIGVQR